MNKLTITVPDDWWEIAPKWAEWITVDSGGGVYAWESKPKPHELSRWAAEKVDLNLSMRIGSLPPQDEWAECIWQRPKKFSPPWDKVASPFDWWVCRKSELPPYAEKYYAYARFFTAKERDFGRHYCPDVWSDLDDAEPEVVYRRPED